MSRALTGTMGKRHDPDTDTLVAHTLSANGADASEDGTGRGTPIVAWTASEMSNSFAWEKPYAATLDSHPMNDTSNRQKGIRVGSLVRRLTPTECERLQSFPDGWTCLCDKKPCTCSDGPRYAALGNAVTVNVAEWIGHRIVAALS